jgi:hypothetical protein
MFHVIDTNIANLYIMYKVHMTWLSKLAKTMSHLKLNVTLARALRKKGHTFYSKGNNNGRGFCTQSWRVGLFYAMDKNIN